MIGRGMRRIAGAVALLSMFTVSCGDARGIDRLRYREARAGARRVLVNRFSDEISYYWNSDKWEKIPPQAKKAVQALYEYQKTHQDGR